MSVNIIFRIAAVGILVTILVQVLKHSGRDEQAFLITLAGLILVLGWVIPYIYDLFESVQTLFTISSEFVSVTFASSFLTTGYPRDWRRILR